MSEPVRFPLDVIRAAAEAPAQSPMQGRLQAMLRQLLEGHRVEAVPQPARPVAERFDYDVYMNARDRHLRYHVGCDFDAAMKGIQAVLDRRWNG